ncbi:hypothetical protein ACROYT_G007898 [Oculina patagonica]
MPLPLFLGALVHSRTRSKDLVDTLYRLGLSVSYERVLGLSADLGNYAISHFETDGTVCQSTLSIGVFTTSAVEKIDHDPTATSAHGSLHGTGITLFQYPDTEKPGTDRTIMRFYLQKTTTSRHSSSCALLPLFPNDPIMVMTPHSMNVVKEAVVVLNPWKTPMITFDQPLHCSRLQSKSSRCSQKHMGRVICRNAEWPTQQDGIAKSTWRFF